MDQLDDIDTRTAPFDRLLGFRRVDEPAGRATILLHSCADHKNLQGTAHGGVLMALLDSVMARAAMYRSGKSESVMSVNISVTFLKRATGQLTAHGQAVGGGKAICFCEGHVVDEAGSTVARATATFTCRSLPSG